MIEICTCALLKVFVQVFRMCYYGNSILDIIENEEPSDDLYTDSNFH